MAAFVVVDAATEALATPAGEAAAADESTRLGSIVARAVSAVAPGNVTAVAAGVAGVATLFDDWNMQLPPSVQPTRFEHSSERQTDKNDITH